MKRSLTVSGTKYVAMNVHLCRLCTMVRCVLRSSKTFRTTHKTCQLDLTGREKEVVWAVQELNAANVSQDCVEAVRPWLCVTLFTSGGCENVMTHCPASTVHFILQSSVYLHNCVPENISGMRHKIYLLHLTNTCVLLLSKACSL